MAVVWSTALGGALHEPAVPFFYLGLGLSPTQIGQAGGILTAGALLLAPVYGAPVEDGTLDDTLRR